MKGLEYENYEDFACEIADRFDSLEDEFGDISIIAKYNEAKEIIRELLCIGYDVASIDIHDEFCENYCDEYIVSVSNVNDSPSIWCEKFKRETGYFTDESNVIYIMDNCSSAVIPYCKSKNLYEVSVGNSDVSEYDDEESETEHTYTVNGKTVDKTTFDEYVSKFVPDLVNNEEKDETSDDEGYSISVKCNLDADEALEIIADMEQRIIHMNEMFCEMDNFRRLFNL